jgi:hypothetical protein
MNRDRYPLMALITAVTLVGCSGSSDGETRRPRATPTISYGEAAALSGEYQSKLFNDLDLSFDIRDLQDNVLCPSVHPVGEQSIQRFYLMTTDDEEPRNFAAVKKWLSQNGFSGITDTSKQSDGETVGAVSGQHEGVRISMHWNTPGDGPYLAPQTVTVVSPCSKPDPDASQHY